MGTDQSAWPSLYPSTRNNAYVHPLTRGQLLIMHPSGDEAGTDSDHNEETTITGEAFRHSPDRSPLK
eukprot:14499363-Heterocapsa_arctica.AAC.1